MVKYHRVSLFTGVAKILCLKIRVSLSLAGIGPSPPANLNWISGREWMEICMIDWLILICTNDCRKLRQSLICTDCMLIRVDLFYLLNCSNNQHFNIFILNRMLSLLFNSFLKQMSQRL